ncbi:hypothetical protein U9M48_029005 [Paspalum notatum var. saurae]|uniref:Uncharacterized protein n=1 Tax=Paspalum notatum var. saurae TaxID=547442 RepID=A0AAQ3X1K8_PASNO
MRLRWRHLPLLPNPIHVRPLANVKVDAPAVAWSLAKERSMEAEVAGTDVTRTDQYERRELCVAKTGARVGDTHALQNGYLQKHLLRIELHHL